MEPKERALEILRRLEAEYPDVKGTALHYETPLDLLVATILSAQATDEQINKITKSLFKKYRSAADYAYAPREELERDIKSSGFYHRKAEAIQEAARVIAEKHGGRVPDTMEELTGLHGVARKTANIVLQGAYGVTVGIAVDTHVDRLSHRLGLTKERNRDKIERDLCGIVPRKDWLDFNFLFVSHGRKTCRARKPDCPGCPIRRLCPRIGVPDAG